MRHKTLHTAFSVTGIIIISKLLGFAKQVLTASTFGATIETDLISLSEGLIGDIKYVLASVLMTALVPAYIQAKEREEKNAQTFATNALLGGSLVVMPLALVVVLAAPWLARLIAPSYEEILSTKLATYLRLFAPTLVLFCWMAVFQAILNANKRFIPGQMEGMNQSLIQIGMILLLSATLGVRVLIVSFFAGTIWNTVYLGFLSRRSFGRPAVSLFRSADIKGLVRMIGPLLVGYSLVYVNQQVDKILVSGLTAGTVTAMGYAAVLSNLIGTIIVAVGSILFPYISERITRGQEEQAAELGVRSAMILLMGILPVNILTVLCAKDIVSIVYGHGAFSAESVEVAAYALAGYGISGVGLVLREVFARFQYGYQDTKQPMINSSFGIILNIILSIALCPVWGVFGVTFASSVSVFVCGILNAITAKQKNAFLSYSLLFRQAPRMIIGGAVCVMTSIAVMHLAVEWHPIWRFGLTIVVGLGAYLVVIGQKIGNAWKAMTEEKRSEGRGKDE